MLEADTRCKLIDPKLLEAGWDEKKIIREYSIAPGRIERIKHAHPEKADYLLCYKNKAMAIVEAKSDECSVSAGVEQAKKYAYKLQKRFAYSTNGKEIYFIDMGVRDEQGNYTKPSTERLVPRFHTPDELWEMLYPVENKWRDTFNTMAFNRDGNRTPRYYQENAINNVLDAIADEKKRILLTMATGTGKTYVAFQICWKLHNAYWNKDNNTNRQPRILFIADRNILANQAKLDFEYFPEDATARITPDELHKNNNQVPKSRNLYFTIFQTFMSKGSDGNPYYMQYNPDFFDLIIIDECHRGGANDESQWRELMDYFTTAYQLGLTATPKRKINSNTYRYFGEPVYSYSLKQGIADGYLTPFRVCIAESPIDEYTYNPDDDVEGEIDENKTYTEQDFYNGNIQMRERDEHRVCEFLEKIDPDEKTIVFCAKQEHAMAIRDLINQHKRRPDFNYCERVTANDGAEGEEKLRQFQNNENLRPTILTTSQKLSTGVDARNVRNIVLLRPVNNMVEFKQIIGRGTRLYDNKYFFTIYDFVGAVKNFQDPEWDGDPYCPVCGNYPCTCHPIPLPTPDPDPEPGGDGGEGGDGETTGEPQPCPVCGNLPCTCEHKKKTVVVQLSEKRKVELLKTSWTECISYGDEIITVADFLNRLCSRLPELVIDQDELRRNWANPQTRKDLLDKLADNNFAEDKLEMLRSILSMEKYDLLDVLEYIGFELKGMKRAERAEQVRRMYLPTMPSEQSKFFGFVLDYYERNGYKELSSDNLGKLIDQKYHSQAEAIRRLGIKPQELREQYLQLQQHLYLQTTVVYNYHIDHLDIRDSNVKIEHLG